MNRRRQSNTEHQRRARIALSVRLGEWLEAEGDGPGPNSAAATTAGANGGSAVLPETGTGLYSQYLANSDGDDSATPSAVREELGRRSMSHGHLAMATGVSQHMILSVARISASLVLN